MISFIQSELRSKEVQNIIGLYLHQIGFPKRWILLTDYCLDAPGKSNVISFVLLYYKNEREHADLEQKILRLQKSDIKHTRYISNRLMRYLKKLPVFSFSFILNKRNILFGDTVKEQRKSVINNLVIIKNGFQSWSKNAPSIDIGNYYQDSIKKLDAQIKQVSQGKKIELLEDILLTTSLGALYTAEILKNVPDLEKVGWFSDRDKITQSCNEIAIPIFHYMLHNCLGGNDVNFYVADPKITGTPFYDILNRIPDDICAAIADYDSSHPSITKEKFSHVLHELMADNPFVRVHKLYKDEISYHFSTLYYQTNLSLTIKFYMQTAVREISGFMKRVKSKICQKLFIES